MTSSCARCGAALASPGAPCLRCASAAAPVTVQLPPPSFGDSAGRPVPTESREPSASGPPGSRPSSVALAPPPPDIRATSPTLEVDDLASDPLLRTVPVRDGGRVLGGVRLVRRIGAGGMGAVYAGHHPVLDLPVAVKILTARIDGSGEERFLREAKLSARVDHPNIVRTRDAGTEHGLFYIQMELIDGVSAGELVRRRGRISEAEAVAIVLDATKGLAEAHRRGIVHRDVKPDNILVLREAIGVKAPLAPGQVRAKLADLGLARALRDPGAAGITGEGSTLGTPAYMAPEQIEDASNVGPAADVYSMGAALYELLCGKQPFTAPTIASLFREILALPPPDPLVLRPDLSGPVCEVLRRSLEKQPARRYASADEMARALEEALLTATRETPAHAPPPPSQAARRSTVPDSSVPPLAPPPSAPAIPPTKEIPPRPPRRRALFAAALAGAVVSVGLYAWWTQGGARPALVVGLLPSERLTTERLKATEPLVALLERVTHRRVELVVNASYSETVDAFVKGRCDLAHLGGVSYVLARERLPSTLPLVQRESDRLYRALFLASVPSGIAKLDEAKGKRFGFVDPLSTSGFVVPATLLLEKGIDPVHDVTPVYTEGHDATLEALARGQLDAGVVDELVYDKLVYLQKFKRTQFTILETSPPFPDDVWVARAGLAPEVRDAVAKAFIALDPAHVQDQLVLRALEAEATRFVPARDEDYEVLRRMIERLREKKLFGE